MGLKFAEGFHSSSIDNGGTNIERT